MCAMLWVAKLFGKLCIATMLGIDLQRSKRSVWELWSRRDNFWSWKWTVPEMKNRLKWKIWFSDRPVLEVINTLLIIKKSTGKSLNYSRGDKDDKKLWFSVSVLIPVTGLKTINETIESVIRQECAEWEILILRNDIQDLPQDTDVAEKDVFYQDNLIREIYIQKRERGMPWM